MTYVVEWHQGSRDAGEARFRTLAEAERFVKERALLDYHLFEERLSPLGGFYQVEVT